MSLSIGERLRSAREARGVSLEEACQATKIQRRILEAIEADRLGEILDPVYARIFIKKYAAFLGLEGSALLGEYLAFPESVPDRPLTVRTEATQQAQREIRSSWSLPLTAGIAALVGVGFMGYLAVDLVGTLRRARSGPSAQAKELLVPLSKPLKLTLVTTDKVWLQVKADGAVIFQNVLSQGARETWTAEKELEIWTGNAGAMRISLNGKPLEGLGRGVRKGVRITRAGLEQ